MNDQNTNQKQDRISADDYAKRVAAQLKGDTANINGSVASRLNQSRQKALDAYREPVSVMGLNVGGGLQALKLGFSERPLMFSLPVLAAVVIAMYAAIGGADNDDDDAFFAEAGRVDAAILASDLPLQSLSQTNVSSLLSN
jgi:hypothetical protein